LVCCRSTKRPSTQSSAQRRSHVTTPAAFSLTRPRLTLLSEMLAARAMALIDGSSRPLA
jgi:hypothetical protein